MDVPLYLYLAYNDLDRLSPPSVETTLNALDYIKYGGEEISILDIACGVGDKTILLANYFENSTVEAIDLFKHNVTSLEEKISQNSLENRIYAYEMDMHDLDFPNEEFDIVFCNAGIEILGFEKGLDEWRRLLKPNGYLIVSDVSWLKKPSNDSKNFWMNNYDDVDTIENKINQIRDVGYEFIDYVITPKSDWKDYYSKLEKNLNKLNSDKSAKNFVKLIKKEMQTYRQNSDDYTYVFYIGRRDK